VDAVWNLVVESWNTLPDAAKGSVFTACATILSAGIAATVVLLQIGRQARNALRQNAHNEKMKLKLKIYEEVLEVHKAAVDAQVAYENYIRLFQTSRGVAIALKAQKIPFAVPNASIPGLIREKGACIDRAIAIILLVEQWGIIDPRIQIFRTAISSAIHDINSADTPYFNAVMPFMPMPAPTAPSQTDNPHSPPHVHDLWQPPDQQPSDALAALENAVLDEIGDLSGIIYDFQIEMQNLLLHDLFGRKIAYREPLNPNIKVIRIDRFEPLTAYFGHDTPWGRSQKEITERVRTKFVRRPDAPQ
jgi:hypothetical protein